MGDDFLYKEESYKINGACFEVYKNLGGDFKEIMINKALAQELHNRGLTIENQKRINIFYKGKKVGVYIPDIIVNGVIIVELKAKPFLTPSDERQFWHYFKATEYKLGFLVNFGSRKLEIKRRVYDKARPSH